MTTTRKRREKLLWKFWKIMAVCVQEVFKRLTTHSPRPCEEKKTFGEVTGPLPGSERKDGYHYHLKTLLQDFRTSNMEYLKYD